MKDIKIIVATHKKYEMPKDKMYLPVHVGSALHPDLDFGHQKDDEGQNISKENPYFCELTGLYWAWKNLDAKYVGLAHYRRHFASHRVLGGKNKRLETVLTKKDAEKALEKVDIVLPKLRKYYVENLYDHYVHTMYPEPLEMTRKIIAEKYPDYLPEFNNLKTRTSAHMFNMFIMKKDLLDDYCDWLFDILFTLEKEVKKKGIDKDYDAFHARFYGRLSELLLDVWIRTNDLDYTELPVLDIEPVNWLKKGSSFLAAKFLGRKYDKSF